MTSNFERKFEDYIINNNELFYRLAYSYVKNTDDALDVVQESIYKAFSSIDSLKDYSYIKTWFYRIIVNTSLDLLRKRKREVVTDEEYIFDENNGECDKYHDIDLKNALDDLPEKYRSIIILRYFEDLKIEEISKVLNENINTVKTRLYKGLKILRISMD